MARVMTTGRRLAAARTKQKLVLLTVCYPSGLDIVDPANTFRTLEVRGDASVEDDPDLAAFDRLVRSYGREPEHFPVQREDRVVLRLTPTRVVATDPNW